MKIAIFSDNFYPEMSGISDSVISIAKGLAQKGHRINFYVPRYSKKNYAISKLKPEELDLGGNIKIIRLFSLPYPPAPTKQGRMVLPMLTSYRHVKKFNPDIIYTQLFFGAGLEALFVSKLLKKPLIGTSHTPITEFLKYSPVKWRWLQKASRKYVNWYYRQCHLTSAPSRSILSEMEEGGFNKKSFILSNPIDFSNFNPVSSEEEKTRLKNKFGLSKQTILYTGRIAREKNIDVIIRALATVKNKFPRITFALTGHGAAEKELKRLAKELGLEKQVIFTGYLDSGKKFAEIYQASDIFCVMSTAEAQCMSMMHAMASALPVVGANARALPEYINAQNGFIVRPGDAEELAEKIIHLFSHPEEMERLGKGGCQHAKNFSASSIIDEWENIFQ